MSTNAPASGGHDEQSLWTQPRFVGAAVIVGLIAVLGVVLLLSGSGDKTSSPAAATPPPPPAAQVQSAGPGGDKSSCNLPAGKQSPPAEAPSDTRWELVGKVIAPTAPKTYGPARRVDGYRACFAHSPLGALYAAVNFWATLTAKPPSDVYRHLAAPSAARATSIKNDQGKGPVSLRGLQIAGFAFSSYADDRATIKLAFRIENGGLVEFDTTMLWTEDGWRYEVPLDQRAPGGQIKDLTDFLPWTAS